MPETPLPSPTSPRSPGPTGRLPEVRLEVRHKGAAPVVYDVAKEGFLIGTVPGCDLRLPGADLPPVLCLISPRSGGAGLRKLALTQPLLVNGQPVVSTLLGNTDRVSLGDVEMVVEIRRAAAKREPAEETDVAPARSAERELAGIEEHRCRLKEQQAQWTAEKNRWDEEKTQSQEELGLQHRALEAQAQRLAAEHQAIDALGKQVAEGRHQLVEQIQAARQRINRKQEAVHRAAMKVLERKRNLDGEVQQSRQEQEESARLCAAQRQELEQDYQKLRDLKSRLTQQADELAAQRVAQEKRAEDLTKQQQDLDSARQQWHERSREFRDRLAVKQEAVQLAAQKVLQAKKLADGSAKELSTQQQEIEQRRVELETCAAELLREQQQHEAQADALRQDLLLLQEKKREFQSRRRAFEQELAQRRQSLDEEWRNLEKATAEREAQHQADVIRLDRGQANLDKRQLELEALARDIDRRHEQLQQDSRDLEEQAQLLAQEQGKLRIEAKQISLAHSEQGPLPDEVAQRAAALEEQQTALASLRTRLERQREELVRGEQALVQQRQQHRDIEAQLARQVQKAHALRELLDKERADLEEERNQLEEERSKLAEIAAHLQQQRDQLVQEGEELRRRILAFDSTTTEQSEESARLQARAAQLAELQERLQLDRQALRDKETALLQAEQVREALQEQLRRRSEELAHRQQQLAEQVRLRAEEAAALETRRVDFEQRQRQTEDRVSALQQELAQREERVRGQEESVRESGRLVEQERRQVGESAAAAARERDEIADLRRQLKALQQQLPEWEHKAQAAADSLVRAREQLRAHLTELHDYARQSQEDLEALHSQVQAEAERVRNQSQTLHRSRDEQRLAMASFRQQLIDWQGQMSSMKQVLAQDESRLEKAQAQVEQTSARLLKQAEQLEEQEREVAERRGEVDRHLADMQEWYRRKLRELAEGRRGDSAPNQSTPPRPAAAVKDGLTEIGGSSPTPGRDILALTGDVEPGDRKLGDLLRSLELVDADSLTALLVEARKQRRSLRQVLLASGYVTLYQLALIEAGNLDGLLLGPVRVVDRLRTTPQEAVYLVFDPRKAAASGFALLRWLAETEMQDAVRPDEYRQRFAAAVAVRHPNLAATWEVLDIAGRPAVLQEYVTGLAGPDWPALAAVPGIWLRLVRQAALGLGAAHEAGLCHGHLHSGNLLLTAEGTLKVSGLGEPPWLSSIISGEPEGETLNMGSEAANDLAALGRIAAGWAALGAARKGGKVKPPPKAVQTILQRLQAEATEKRYADAAALLEDLDRQCTDVPPHAEGWDRLLAHVREHVGEIKSLRESA